MGMGSSKSMPITKDELEAVQSTWKVVMENAEENGMFIFKTFLQKHNYFRLFKKFADTPFDELPENPAFRSHAGNIIRQIDNVILNLDNADYIKAELTALGQSHATRKIQEHQFEELKIVILEILENEFKLPEEALQAWTKTLNNAFLFVFEGLSSDQQ